MPYYIHVSQMLSYRLRHAGESDIVGAARLNYYDETLQPAIFKEPQSFRRHAARVISEDAIPLTYIYRTLYRQVVASASLS